MHHTAEGGRTEVSPIAPESLGKERNHRDSGLPPSARVQHPLVCPDAARCDRRRRRHKNLDRRLQQFHSSVKQQTLLTRPRIETFHSTLTRSVTSYDCIR